MQHIRNEIHELLQAGHSLSQERDSRQILHRVLSFSMSLARCDTGILYLCQNGLLHAQLFSSRSQKAAPGPEDEAAKLPPLPIDQHNVCGYTAVHKEPLNIPEIAQHGEFDFSILRLWEQMTGTQTHSSLTIPLMDWEGRVMGVLQLLNAMDEKGQIIPFDPCLEQLLLSLAAMAAIAMDNLQFTAELRSQMWSFTSAMAEAMDMRTHYNASHIRMVAHYAALLADHINEKHAQGTEPAFFTKEHKEQLVFSAFLHDIGKIAIPSRVMNKTTRLDYRLGEIESRFALIQARYEIQYLEGRLTQADYEAAQNQLEMTLSLVREIDPAGFLTEEKKQQLLLVLDKEYVGKEGRLPYFTPEEKECLLIAQGTLTDRERQIMESHVEITERILSKVHFRLQDQCIAIWAAQHHEFLDGSGYPRHLKGDQLPLESRILTVADICDALLARDRPYKKPLPPAKAFSILHQMAHEGKLDDKIVTYLEECLCGQESPSALT